MSQQQQLQLTAASSIAEVSPKRVVSPTRGPTRGAVSGDDVSGRRAGLVTGDLGRAGGEGLPVGLACAG